MYKMLTKNIVLLIAFVVSLNACAFIKVVNKNNDTQSLKIQSLKTIEKGAVFDNSSDSYQLIENGYATKDDANIDDEELEKIGKHQLFISDNQNYKTQQSAQNTGDYKQIAINQRTGKLVIITGKLVVKLKDINLSQTIADAYGLTISSEFKRLNTVFFDVNNQDIITLKDTIIKDENVTSARIDLIEHIRVPH